MEHVTLDTDFKRLFSKFKTVSYQSDVLSLKLKMFRPN